MRLSWNEVRARAVAFSKDWKDAAYEKGETQSFVKQDDQSRRALAGSAPSVRGVRDPKRHQVFQGPLRRG